MKLITLINLIKLTNLINLAMALILGAVITFLAMENDIPNIGGSMCILAREVKDMAVSKVVKISEHAPIDKHLIGENKILLGYKKSVYVVEFNRPIADCMDKLLKDVK